MFQVRLEGNYEAMGEAHGKILKQAGLVLPPADPKMRVMAEACEALLDKYSPDLMKEIEGFVSASGVDASAFKTLLFTATCNQTAPSCSVVAVTPGRSQSGSLLVGRNYDFVYQVSKPGATTYFTYPAGKHASLGNADVWIGREDGLNEAGLFVAMSATFLPGLQPGLAFWFIVRMLLDQCADVGEALSLIQSLPHLQSRNYMLADRVGRAVVVEASVTEIVVREPEDGVLVMTNHHVSPVFAGKEAFVPPDSPVRYQRLRSLAAGNGKIGLQDIRQALGDRDSYVCAHGDFMGQAFGTIWSLVGELDENSGFEMADGVPEGQMQYRAYQL